MPMPYTLSKGPILAVLEDLLNPETKSEVERLYAGLALLRDPSVPLTSIGLVDSTNIKTEGVTLDPLEERLNEYWFGKIKKGGGWDPQPAFGRRHTATGYWYQYYGDVEGILRETLIRTIELSLGIDAGADPKEATRHWEVEVFWKCGNPWVEGWVTWRRNRRHPDTGQVTTIISTPADTMNHLRRHPARPPDGAPGLRTPSKAPDESHGVWLVTQPDHVLVGGDGKPKRSNAGFIGPKDTWHDEGDVTVVALTTAVGGAAPNGLAYRPPAVTKTSDPDTVTAGARMASEQAAARRGLAKRTAKQTPARKKAAAKKAAAPKQAAAKKRP